MHVCPRLKPYSYVYAAVAELADAQDLKSCGGDIVPVRFRSAAVVEDKRNVEDTAFLFFNLQEIAFLQIKNTLPKA